MKKFFTIIAAVVVILCVMLIHNAKPVSADADSVSFMGVTDALSYDSYQDAVDAPYTAAWIDADTPIIGDHNYQGFWRLYFAEIGKTLLTVNRGGTTETYVCFGKDLHAENCGSYLSYDAPAGDLIVYTCNPVSSGESVTVTTWKRM